MPIIDFRNDTRVDDYYRQIPKWVDSNRAYRKYLYQIGDHETLKNFNYNMKRLGKENRRWPIESMQTVLSDR